MYQTAHTFEVHSKYSLHRGWLSRNQIIWQNQPRPQSFSVIFFSQGVVYPRVEAWRDRLFDRPCLIYS